MEVLKSIWLFIQNQVLGMKWLNEVIGSGLSAVGLDVSSRIGGSIQFLFTMCLRLQYCYVFLFCNLIYSELFSTGTK